MHLLRSKHRDSSEVSFAGNGIHVEGDVKRIKGHTDHTGHKRALRISFELAMTME